ncbi:hypothetical protein C8J57DRAFT_1626832 [Mycena rebaudengoi]|nr:hypothetical protein C8J57DRAFT_1626832 [Mycena rebaudengoi]
MEHGFDICIEEYRHTVIPPCDSWHDRGADVHWHAMGHAAHVRDSVRYTPSRKEMNTLRLLGIVPPDFNLDDPSSLHWVHFLLGILQTERIRRQAYYQQHKKAPWRKWNPTWVEGQCVLFERILLYPEVLFTQEEPTLRWQEGGLDNFYPGHDGYLHEHGPNGPRLPAFQSAKLNPFLVALSCHDKMADYFKKRRQSRSNLPDATSPHHELFQKLDALVDEIYRPLESIPDIPPLYSRDALAPADVLAANSVLQVDSMLSPTGAFPTHASPANTDYNLESNAPALHVPPVGLRERIADGQALLFKPIEDWEDSREDLTGVVDGAQTGTSPIDALAPTEVSRRQMLRPGTQCCNGKIPAHLPPVGLRERFSYENARLFEPIEDCCRAEEDLQERIAYGQALLFKPIEDWHLSEDPTGVEDGAH